MSEIQHPAAQRATFFSYSDMAGKCFYDYVHKLQIPNVVSVLVELKTAHTEKNNNKTNQQATFLFGRFCAKFPIRPASTKCPSENKYCIIDWL